MNNPLPHQASQGGSVSRRVVITGGGSGIGRTFARRFAAQGDRVAICDISDNAIATMQKEIPDAIAMTADVRDEQQMAVFFETINARWGGVDVLCANAGTGGPADLIEDIDYQEWQNCIAVNLHGAFLACRWAARIMRAQKQGVIIITSSTSGQWGVPYRSPYVSAKWALIGLTKTLAMELGPDGVRVNAIAPGAVEGDRMERVLEMESQASGRSIEETRDLYTKGVSLQSWVSEDDLANTVLFLSSPASAKISGQVIAIDGNTETMVP